jgi:hypothetical protein
MEKDVDSTLFTGRMKLSWNEKKIETSKIFSRPIMSFFSNGIE